MNVCFLVCKTTSSILWINIINYKLGCVLWLTDCDWEELVIWRTVTDRNMMVVGWPCVVDWMLKSKNWLKFLTIEWRVLPCSGLPGSASGHCILSLLFLRWQALVLAVAQIQLNFARTLYIARLLHLDTASWHSVWRPCHWKLVWDRLLVFVLNLYESF